MSSTSARLRSHRLLRPRSRRVFPRWIVGLAAGAVIVICAVAFVSTFLELYRLQREADRLLRMRRALQQETAVLREEIRLLHTPEYIEKIAREQLGLVKPGELALLIVQPPPRTRPTPIPARDKTPWLAQIVRAIARLFSLH